jgi:aminoglycoside phosphotransferase family enzyme/predicted kinase
LEWAVKMVRLPAEATLRACLERGEVGPDVVASLARRLAEFHSGAERSPAIAQSGRFAAVARNARENLTAATGQVGTTVSRSAFERLTVLTEEALERLRGTIEARAARGVPCDTHGDLRLDHVYLLPGRDAPALAIIDGIEFSERFRHADPVADMAFLVMDLQAFGRRDVAAAFADAYFDAAGDGEGRSLLAFYTSYRAAVRGKVEGIKAAAAEVAEDDRRRALQKSRARWLLALGVLEEFARRPSLVLVGGLPGSGKSSLAEGLAAAANFTVIRSDVVRKELAGIAPELPSTDAVRERLYTSEWTDRTYAECLRRAEGVLFEGKRVLIDATFGAEAKRRLFLEAADQLGVPGALLLCQAGRAVSEQRLRQRRNDASDADWQVYLQAAGRWEPLGLDTRARTVMLGADPGPESVLSQALEALARRGLAAEVKPG